MPELVAGSGTPVRRNTARPGRAAGKHLGVATDGTPSTSGRGYMYPNPPVARTRTSGWLGCQPTRLKFLAVAGAVTLGFAGVAFAAATPASADPGTVYIAVGSDVIQDVMNGFAFATGGGIGGTILASYNAENPVTGITHENISPGKIVGGTSQTNCSFTRPVGTGEGFNALDYSLNQSSTLAQDAVPPQAGCIDIARSSSGPGSVASSGPGAADTSGGLVYIPFALDAVTGATGPSTSGQTTTTECVTATAGCTNVVNGIGTISFTVPTTNITNANLFTSGTGNILNTLYTCVPGKTSPNDFVTVGTGSSAVNYFPNGDAASGPTGQTNVNIDLYVTAPGSGTLKFWASKVGFSATSLPSCVHQSILTGPAAGIAVQEGDGSVVASDPNGYVPFSIAQWIAEGKGLDDRRHTAVLQNINGVAPTVSNKLNTAFPFIREVFNVMQYGAVVSGAGITGQTFDPTLSGLFSTTNSALCQNTFLIAQYGFATLPTSGGPTPDQCGAATASLRVQETNTGPN